MLFGSPFVSLGGNSQLAMIYKKRQAAVENQLAFEMLFNHYSNLAITRFDWENLPDSVDERFLNITLYMYGQAAFFRDPNLGFMALPCTLDGEYNVYYEPITVNAFSFNYEKRLSNRVTEDEDAPPNIPFVYMRNNPTATPTLYAVMEYTKRLADILRSIDVLIKKLKNPFIFTCQDKERLSVENFVKNILDNEVCVIGSKDFGLKQSTFKIEDIQVKTDLTLLWESYKNIESLLLTSLGIENIDVRKRERQLMDEVRSNNMQTDMSVEINIKELQLACEKINRKYNLDVWVEAKKLKDYHSEVIYNGAVYNRTEEVNSSGL